MLRVSLVSLKSTCSRCQVVHKSLGINPSTKEEQQRFAGYASYCSLKKALRNQEMIDFKMQMHVDLPCLGRGHKRSRGAWTSIARHHLSILEPR